jgi:HJR/Mrr/RecB family endonuclease
MPTIEHVCFDNLAVHAMHYAHRRRTELIEGRGMCDRIVWKQVDHGLRLFKDGLLRTLPWLNRRCAFCNLPLALVERIERGDAPDDEEFLESMAALELCINCRYWRWHLLASEFEAREGSYTHYYISFISKLNEFAVSLPDGCSAELAQWIRRHPRAWDTMPPRRLETFVSDVFRANVSDAEVVHVGGTSDGGVDIVLVQNDAAKWLIQVKRRSDGSKGEGVSTIRNLLGAMLLHPSRYGIVVSTADHFTFQARQAVNTASGSGRVIKLVDRGILDLMTDSLLPVDPWSNLLPAPFSAYVTWLNQKLALAKPEAPTLFNWAEQSALQLPFYLRANFPALSEVVQREPVSVVTSERLLGVEGGFEVLDLWGGLPQAKRGLGRRFRPGRRSNPM